MNRMRKNANRREDVSRLLRADDSLAQCRGSGAARQDDEHIERFSKFRDRYGNLIEEGFHNLLSEDDGKGYETRSIDEFLARYD